MKMNFIFPYPKNISVNHMYVRNIHGVFLHPKVHEYRRMIREQVKIIDCNASNFELGKRSLFGSRMVAVHMIMRPPDKRKRDIDGVLKVILDAMEQAGVYDDDCQIERLVVRKEGMKEGGEIEIEISDINDRTDMVQVSSQGTCANYCL